MAIHKFLPKQSKSDIYICALTKHSYLCFSAHLEPQRSLRMIPRVYKISDTVYQDNQFLHQAPPSGAF